MSGAELPIIMAVGQAVGIGGTLMGGAAQARAGKQNAEFKRLQAQELLDRQAINEEVMLNQFRRQSLEVGSAQLSRGGNFAGAGATAQMYSDYVSNLEISRREADFKARMLRAGAEIETNLASDAYTAAVITGVGQAVNTGASIYKYYKGPGKVSDLPG